jgi:hypothetical protein
VLGIVGRAVLDLVRLPVPDDEDRGDRSLGDSLGVLAEEHRDQRLAALPHHDDAGLARPVDDVDDGRVRLRRLASDLCVRDAAVAEPFGRPLDRPVGIEVGLVGGESPQRHPFAVLADERRDEVRESVVVDDAANRNENGVDLSRRVRQQDRRRADFARDAVDRLLAVVGEHHARLGVAAGVDERSRDVVDGLLGPVFELQARLFGRGLLGEDVVAEDDHLRRREELHERLGDRLALQNLDGDEDHRRLADRQAAVGDE